jgi:hypothetical protein
MRKRLKQTESDIQNYLVILSENNKNEVNRDVLKLIENKRIQISEKHDAIYKDLEKQN